MSCQCLDLGSYSKASASLEHLPVPDISTRLDHPSPAPAPCPPPPSPSDAQTTQDQELPVSDLTPSQQNSKHDGDFAVIFSPKGKIHRSRLAGKRFTQHGDGWE